jgi:hypothetical protein
MNATYLDATAKHALDALVARLEQAVAGAADRSLASPLDDLRGRLAGLGEREGEVLRHIDLVISTQEAGAARLGALHEALDAAATRTVHDVSRAVEGGLERILAGQLMEAWQHRLREALAEQQASVQQDLQAMASSLQAMQAETRRLLDGGVAELPRALERSIEEVVLERGRAAWREDLGNAVEGVSANLRQTLLPAATALEQRLDALPARVASELGEVLAQANSDATRSALREEVQAVLAPVEARHEKASGQLTARWEVLEAGLAATRADVRAMVEKDEAVGEQLNVVARGTDSVSGRIALIQETLATNTATVRGLNAMGRWAVGLGLLNAIALLALLGSLLAGRIQL